MQGDPLPIELSGKPRARGSGRKSWRGQAEEVARGRSPVAPGGCSGWALDGDRGTGVSISPAGFPRPRAQRPPWPLHLLLAGPDLSLAALVRYIGPGKAGFCPGLRGKQGASKLCMQLIFAWAFSSSASPTPKETLLSSEPTPLPVCPWQVAPQASYSRCRTVAVWGHFSWVFHSPCHLLVGLFQGSSTRRVVSGQGMGVVMGGSVPTSGADTWLKGHSDGLKHSSPCGRILQHLEPAGYMGPPPHPETKDKGRAQPVAILSSSDGTRSRPEPPWPLPT